VGVEKSKRAQGGQSFELGQLLEAAYLIVGEVKRLRE